MVVMMNSTSKFERLVTFSKRRSTVTKQQKSQRTFLNISYIGSGIYK